MFSSTDIASLVLVGAFWGCTNPLLRQGSTKVASSTHTSNLPNELSDSHSIVGFVSTQLSAFRHVSVWLPYAMNQAGSVLFYFTLSKIDISIAVPACNALALVFSIGTSWWILKEPVNRPVHTILGAGLVVGGVALCLHSSENMKNSATLSN